MIKVFLDSNVWLRPLIETTAQANDCQNLFRAIDQGKCTPYTSTIVLLEVNHVLTSFYRVSPKTAAADIEALLQTKNLTLIEKTNFPQTFTLFHQTGIKLTDCLIAAQIPPKAIAVTYDKHFTKFPHLTTETPHQLLHKLHLQRQV